MPNLDLYQTGTEPEFFITTIAKIETVAGNAVRFYCASERGIIRRLEYTVVIPTDLILPMTVQTMRAMTDCERLRAGGCPLVQ